MKVLLVKPYGLNDSYIRAPISLGYLATAIRLKHQVEILDCAKEKIKIDRLSREIDKLKPDLVGIQCYTTDLRFTREALKTCREINKGIITVIGGPHPSSVPKETMEYFKDTLDYLFVGEAELGFPMLLDRLGKKDTGDFSEIPGLVWREDGYIHINPRAFVEDLDSLGMPAWDILRPEEYPDSSFYRKFPVAFILPYRGCPFLCTFCTGSMVSGRKIRKHSIDHVIKEIQLLYNRHNIREFHFEGTGALFLDKEYTKELLRRLIALKLDISWTTPSGIRIDTIDEEMLQLMKESGLYFLYFGIESGSDRVLGLMKKNLTVEKIRQGIKMVHKSGIDMGGFFIFGFPGERRDEIEKTVSLSLELGMVRAKYFIYLPFPGTESYDELISNGKLKDPLDYDRCLPYYVPEGMNRRELKALPHKMHMRFYLRPKIILKILWDMRSLRHFRFLVKKFFWLIVSGANK